LAVSPHLELHFDFSDPSLANVTKPEQTALQVNTKSLESNQYVQHVSESVSLPVSLLQKAWVFREQL